MLKTSLTLALAIAFSTVSTAAYSNEQLSTLNISATGVSVAPPDMAIVTSGVLTHGETARDALNANNQAMDALLDVLDAAGIEFKHVQTSGFSVQPNYVHSDKRDKNGYVLPPKINGYRVSNMVTVNVMDLTVLGDVLDRSVTVGANSINGVQFSVANPSKLLDEARKKAVSEAIKNAQIYAEAGDFELARILNISEERNYSAQPYVEMARMSMDSASVPVQGGELNYSINVNIQWEISQ